MEDVRMKIVEMIAKVPDNQLDGLLSYVEAMMKLTEIDTIVGERLDNIMAEDDNLLKRLAQ